MRSKDMANGFCKEIKIDRLSLCLCCAHEYGCATSIRMRLEQHERINLEWAIRDPGTKAGGIPANHTSRMAITNPLKNKLKNLNIWVNSKVLDVVWCVSTETWFNAYNAFQLVQGWNSMSVANFVCKFHILTQAKLINKFCLQIPCFPIWKLCIIPLYCSSFILFLDLQSWESMLRPNQGLVQSKLKISQGLIIATTLEASL